MSKYDYAKPFEALPGSFPDASPAVSSESISELIDQLETAGGGELRARAIVQGSGREQQIQISLPWSEIAGKGEIAVMFLLDAEVDRRLAEQNSAGSAWEVDQKSIFPRH